MYILACLGEMEVQLNTNEETAIEYPNIKDYWRQGSSFTARNNTPSADFDTLIKAGSIIGETGFFNGISSQSVLTFFSLSAPCFVICLSSGCTTIRCSSVAKNTCGFLSLLGLFA